MLNCVNRNAPRDATDTLDFSIMKRTPPDRGRPVVLRSLLVIVGALIVLSACGCGEEKAAPVEQPARRSYETRAALGETSPAAAIRGALLRVPDLPAGWTETGHVRPSVPCEENDPFATARSAASSPRFESGASAGLQQRIAIYPHPADARKAFEIINESKALSCFRRSVRRQVSREARGRASRLVTLRVDTLSGGAQATRYTASVSNAFGVFRVFIDLVNLRSGRGIGSLVAIARVEPVEEELTAQLVARSMQRLRRAVS